MGRRRLLLLGASFLPSLMISLAAPLSVAADQDHYITVRPESFLSIFPGGDNRAVSSYQFVVGPPGQPLGAGSLELTTVDVAGKQQHVEYAQFGAPISTINEMSYSTYKHLDPKLVAVVSINLEIYTNPSTNPPSGSSTLVFEPYLIP